MEIKNNFKVDEIPENTQIVFSLGGGNLGVCFWTLRKGSPIRNLLESQERFESWSGAGYAPDIAALPHIATVSDESVQRIADELMRRFVELEKAAGDWSMNPRAVAAGHIKFPDSPSDSQAHRQMWSQPVLRDKGAAEFWNQWYPPFQGNVNYYDDGKWSYFAITEFAEAYLRYKTS